FLRKSNEYAINTLYHKCTVFVSFNYKFIWGAIADYFNIPTPKTVCIKDGEVLGEPFEAQKYIRKEISESASINLSNDSIMNNFEWKNIEKKIFCCKSVFQELKLKSLF
ncbi:hypothetical protein, partial [Streptococcus suis]